MLRESVGQGTVSHRRYVPKRHSFSYPAFYTCVDLERLAQDPGFHISALEGCADVSTMRAEVLQQIEQRGHVPPAGRILVLAQPTFAGKGFNPVVFFFCFGSDGDDLKYILARINNTPWDEVYTYVLDVAQAQHREDGSLVFNFDKNFHVSPFAPMQLCYRWRFKLTQTRIEIGMRLLDQDQDTFFAGLRLDCEPLAAATLVGAARRYPLQNLRTLGRIYIQAAKLWFKGVPFYDHPKHEVTANNPKEATDERIKLTLNPR